jgi:hypothetical protein
MESGSEAWNRAIDRVVDKTTERISKALDRMVDTLPEGAAPQMAIELVVARLADHQSWFMRLIMEDEYIREAYYAAVARRPADPHRPWRPRGL